ncbi:MAG: hypothetical protein AB201_00290 [Parcubacteria bacterium C7867-006]|nr:MAG: hypothetical protein AB201_00290 [Parcubacteria bacterium C7867-006]
MKKTKGMALVEIIIGSAIISVGILAAITSYNTYINYALANNKNIQASYILEEGLEVMTFFRDVSWTNISGLSTTTTYHLVFNGVSWATTTTPEYVDGEFLRSITVSDVKRNGSDQIDISGVYDPNIKMITTTVDYSQGHTTTTKSISTYITNINAN